MVFYAHVLWYTTCFLCFCSICVHVYLLWVCCTYVLYACVRHMYYNCVMLHVYMCKCGVSCLWCEVHVCVVWAWVGTFCVVCDLHICMCACVRASLQWLPFQARVTNSSQFAWDFPDFSTESPNKSQANRDGWSLHPAAFQGSWRTALAPLGGVWRPLLAGAHPCNLGLGLQSPLFHLHFRDWGLPFSAPLQDTQGFSAKWGNTPTPGWQGSPPATTLKLDQNITYKRTATY